MRGSTVCHAHGGRAPQVKRAAELRLAEARDDALSTLAIQVKWNLQKVEKLSNEKDGIPAGAIELRDLISVVDKFTTLAELLAGRATERTHVQITEVQQTIAVLVGGFSPFVAVDKRADFLAWLEEVKPQLAIESVAA